MLKKPSESPNVSEFLQHIEDTWVFGSMDLLPAPGIRECWPPARRSYGSERTVEYWVLGICKSGFIRKNSLQEKLKSWTFTSYPIIPVFQHFSIFTPWNLLLFHWGQHSNWGEAPKFIVGIQMVIKRNKLSRKAMTVKVLLRMILRPRKSRKLLCNDSIREPKLSDFLLTLFWCCIKSQAISVKLCGAKI